MVPGKQSLLLISINLKALKTAIQLPQTKWYFPIIRFPGTYISLYLPERESTIHVDLSIYLFVPWIHHGIYTVHFLHRPGHLESVPGVDVNVRTKADLDGARDTW